MRERESCLGMNPKPVGTSGLSMRQAVIRDDVEFIRNVLAHGWDIEADIATDESGVRSEGETLLMLAATRGSNRVVRLLLDQGAQPDSRDNSGCTALMHAAAKGHGGSIAMLLKSNADTELHSSSGSNALHYAAENGHSVAIQRLVNGNADMNAKDDNDRSAPVGAFRHIRIQGLFVPGHDGRRRRGRPPARCRRRGGLARASWRR